MDTLQKFIDKYDLSQKLQDEEFRGATYILNLLIEDGTLVFPSDESLIVERIAEVYKEIHSDKDLGELSYYDIDIAALHLYYGDNYCLGGSPEHVKLDITVGVS